MSDRPSQAPSDKLIEVIARSLTASSQNHLLTSPIWIGLAAEAAIAAIEAAGYAVVPLEPTSETLTALSSYCMADGDEPCRELARRVYGAAVRPR